MTLDLSLGMTLGGEDITGSVVPPPTFGYRRPGGVFLYFRPDGVSTYVRP